MIVGCCGAASWLLSKIVAALETEGVFHDVREIELQGRRVRQYVAETPVILHRPAKTRQGGRQRAVPGRPLSLRLVVVQARDEEGQTPAHACNENARMLSQWLLLTNVPTEFAGGEQVAL
jgi:hypothetical protein